MKEHANRQATTRDRDIVNPDMTTTLDANDHLIPNREAIRMVPRLWEFHAGRTAKTWRCQRSLLTAPGQTLLYRLRPFRLPAG
jgi:hypothetical protein